MLRGFILVLGNHEKRVADIVVRELKRVKPDAWTCIQDREVWSTEINSSQSKQILHIPKCGLRVVGNVKNSCSRIGIPDIQSDRFVE